MKYGQCYPNNQLHLSLEDGFTLFCKTALGYGCGNKKQVPLPFWVSSLFLKEGKNKKESIEISESCNPISWTDSAIIFCSETFPSSPSKFEVNRPMAKLWQYPLLLIAHTGLTLAAQNWHQGIYSGVSTIWNSRFPKYLSNYCFASCFSFLYSSMNRVIRSSHYIDQ